MPSSDEVHPTGNSTGGAALGAFTYAVTVPVPNVGTAAGSTQQALFGEEAYFYAQCDATDALGAAVYANTTLAYVTTADANSPQPVVGFIVAKASDTACTVQRYGESSLVFAGLVTGKRYFLASLGGITTPPFPSDSVEFVQQVGNAISGNKLFIQPTGTVIRRDLNGDDQVVCCSSLLSSVGVPSPGFGKNGDFCVDSVATRLYGPKTSGSWGDGVTLVGAQGAPGATGTGGPAGPTGVAGEQGELGPVGPAGAVGPQGDAGPTGANGAAGANGDVGAVGPAGATGPAGDVGPPGPIGPEGSTGDAGAVGPQGAAGDQGALGPQGEAGPTGATGGQGGQGEAGAVGPAGPAGSDGQMGATGPQGAVGSDGKNGATGPVGPLGPTGPQGDAGKDGQDGAAGAAGPQGNIGPAGAQGIAGAAGATIVNGQAAPTAQDGQDGDYFYDQANTTFFGPKASGAWPATGVQMTGQNGQNGADGTRWFDGDGPPAADNTYPPGSYYYDRTNNQIYPPAA